MNKLPSRYLLAWLLIFCAACGQGGDGGSGPGSASEVNFHEFETPREIGTGLLNGMTPDGSAAYVEEPDPRFPEPGCEGQPEPVMFRLPLAGGDRTLVGQETQPLHGTLVRGGSGRRIAVVSACESFFTEMFVAQESADGMFSDVTEVTPEIPEGFLLNPSSLSWSNDGSALLGSIQDVDAPDGDPSQIVSIDPDSGRLTKLFDAEQGTGVFKVGQLENGRYVISTNLVVSFREPDGALIAEFQGKNFEIGPDLRQVAIYGTNVMLASQEATTAEQLVEQQTGREISSVHFAPGGRAVVLNRYLIDGGQVEVGIVTLGDRRFTSVVTGAQYGRSYFSGDGKALGFNLFGSEPPDFTTRVYVTRFEEAG